MNEVGVETKFCPGENNHSTGAQQQYDDENDENAVGAKAAVSSKMDADCSQSRYGAAFNNIHHLAIEEADTKKTALLGSQV